MVTGLYMYSTLSCPEKALYHAFSHLPIQSHTGDDKIHFSHRCSLQTEARLP